MYHWWNTAKINVCEEYYNSSPQTNAIFQIGNFTQRIIRLIYRLHFTIAQRKAIGCMQIPANCINTNGPLAPGVAEWFYAFVESSRANGKCERSVRCDRESRFYRGKGGGGGGHREWVSRGNKFWQIVLPALYTVAHEVERSVPSVPLGHPSAIGVFSFRSFLSRFEVPLRVRAPRLLRVKETCALCPWRTLPFSPRYLSRSASHTLFPYSSFALLDLPISPSPLSIPLGINSSPSIFCERIPDFLIAINARPIAAPSVAVACNNVSAPRFSYLKFRSYPPPRSYSRIGFPRFFPIEIDACLFASLSPRVLTPVSLSHPASYSFRSSSSARLSPDVCLIFAATVDFRPLAPARAALVCICVSILRSFLPITLPRLSSLPFSRRLFRHNWYPHAAVSRLASHFSQLMYQFLIARSTPHFLPTINILSRSVYVRLATREILNPLDIIFQREKEICTLSAFKDARARANGNNESDVNMISSRIVRIFTPHSQPSRIHEAIYARFSIEAPRSIPIAFPSTRYICLHVDTTLLSNMHESPFAYSYGWRMLQSKKF